MLLVQSASWGTCYLSSCFARNNSRQRHLTQNVISRQKTPITECPISIKVLTDNIESQTSLFHRLHHVCHLLHISKKHGLVLTYCHCWPSQWATRCSVRLEFCREAEVFMLGLSGFQWPPTRIVHTDGQHRLWAKGPCGSQGHYAIFGMGYKYRLHTEV